MEALSLSELLSLDGTVYYADGVPAGFLIAQTLAPTLAAIRFAKGVDAFKEIYQHAYLLW